MLNICTIIVTFNGEKWIRSCLQSLELSTVPTQIIIVDNSSSDNTLKIIETSFSNVIILKQSDNLGFGKANNIGISHALKQEADYVFLLNQDARIEPNTISDLVSKSQRNKEYGILSPIHFNWKGDELEYYFKQFIQKNNGLSQLDEVGDFKRELYKLSFVNAAAWLLPIKTLKTVGGFDPLFYHYGEDNNYCQRILYHQLKIGIVSKAKIYHDSTIRTRDIIPLFSDTYFKQEIKQLLIKYANINRKFGRNDRNEMRVHQGKVLVRNLKKMNLKSVIGYLKKYLIFELAFCKIRKSRTLNESKGAHYL